MVVPERIFLAMVGAVLVQVVVLLAYYMHHGAPINAVFRLTTMSSKPLDVCAIQSRASAAIATNVNRTRLSAPAGVRVSGCNCSGPDLMTRVHNSNVTGTILSPIDVHVYIDNGRPCNACYRDDPTALVLDVADDPHVSVGRNQVHAFKTFVLMCSPANIVSIPFPPFALFPEQSTSDREYLLTFVGTFYLIGQGTERLSMLALNDMHPGVAVMGRCLKSHGEHLLQPFYSFCQRLDKQVDEFGDISRLSNTTFGLVPAGRQPGSFRLAEMLLQNIIPVFIVPANFVLPFSELLTWPEVSLRFTHENLNSIVPTLMRITPAQISTMQNRIRNLSHLFQLEHIIRYALNISGIETVPPDD